MEAGLLGAGEIISATWCLYRRNWKVLVGIVACLFLPITIMGTTLEVLGLQGISLAWSAVSAILGCLMAVALITAVHRVWQGWDITIVEAYRVAPSRLWPYLCATVLASLAISVGTFLFIIPGLIFSVWFAFVAFVVVIEGVRGVSALSRSKKLVVGRWWAVCWRLVAPIFCYTLLYIAAFLAVAIILYGVLRSAPGQFSQLSDRALPILWRSSAMAIVGTFALPIFTIIGFIVYENLKEGR